MLQNELQVFVACFIVTLLTDKTNTYLISNW